MRLAVCKVDEIVIREPFKSLWPARQAIEDAIVESIAAEGFRGDEPIAIWANGKNTLIDGHTRLAAAKRSGLDAVPVALREFATEDDALAWAIARQRDRRNLSDAEILSALAVLDRLKATTPGKGAKQQRTEDLASREAKSPQEGKSANETAVKLGVSRAKVERARAVAAHAPEEVREAVERGEMSINKASRIATARKREKREAEQPKTSRPVFNRTTDSIEWARWTWNPVTGCENDCPYCYAHDIAIRFGDDFKPKFREERLAAPANTKPPAAAATDIGERNVFVCSMGDLFGKWVPKKWILAVLGVVNNHPEWNFLFLTKSPRRYREFDWPKNAWLGATVDSQKRVTRTEEAFDGLRASVRWVSCEPLLGPVVFSTLVNVDWIVIGGQSAARGLPASQPEWAWVESLAGQARTFKRHLYFKPNLTIRPREYPR
jgi:protein gp37/ParB-like chromosome segregation protein Spo0J